MTNEAGGARGDEVKATSPSPRHLRPQRAPVKAWPVALLALPAFVAIWGGWVELGRLTGFGVVHPLPGIWDDLKLDTAITLPVGVETYAAFALFVWLSGRAPTEQARKFAKWSAIGSLAFGAAGQIAYHLMEVSAIHKAPVLVTTLVACLPVGVLGMGAALAHLVRGEGDEAREATPPARSVGNEAEAWLATRARATPPPPREAKAMPAGGATAPKAKAARPPRPQREASPRDELGEHREARQLEALALLAAEAGKVPGREAVKAALRLSSDKADRLIKAYREAHPDGPPSGEAKA